jgi:prepilin-type N-terminal cleavage/methylation domain-containing protein
MAPAYNRTPLARPPRRAGFVLVEVLLALTILGIAAMAFMESFTLSLEAARRMEIITQSEFFARQLLDEWEIFPPAEGESEGGFGDTYRNYFYTVDVQYIDPGDDYDRDLEIPDDVEQLFALRMVHLEVYYDDGRHEPIKAIALDTAIVGAEKFSVQSKQSYLNF